MKHPYSLTERSISVIIGGKVFQTDRSNPGWSRIKALLNDDTSDDAELIALFAPIEGISRVSNKKVTVKNGQIFWGDDEIHNSLSRRMVDVMNEGLDLDPWIKLMENIYDNPSPMARTEFYEFMERANLPMTPDGCVIAFKKVNADFTDCYSGRFDNSVGQYVSMPREAVDPIRDHLCSSGLHFCSKAYLPHTPGEVTLLLKINPRDVVSIPTDFDQSKGRTCAYEVVGVIEPEVAQAIEWSPVEARHGEYHWGWSDDTADDEPDVDYPEDFEVFSPPADVPKVEYIESVVHGKITATKFEQLLKKHKTQAGIARALGLSRGTVQTWRARLLG